MMPIQVDAYIGVAAVSKAVLVAYLKDMIQQGLIPAHAEFVLAINLPCGQGAAYQSVGDIPDVSTLCPCGDPKHWLIKYSDIRLMPTCP